MTIDFEPVNRRAGRRRDMPRISCGRAFLEILKQEGVRHIFGNPGTTELPLMDSLGGEKEIRYFLCLHEGVAISMAEGYSVASGNLGVANVHTTPGVGNSMGMLYNAFKANAPLLVTAGQHDQSFLLSEPILFSEIPEIPKPFVKWSYEVHHTRDLARAVHRAAKIATSLPTAPVFLSLPADMLRCEEEIDLGAPTRVDPRPRPSRAAIAAAADMLAAAGHPVIIAGDAVARGDAHAELARVAELIGAPVYEQTISGMCNFPSSHPLSMGPLPRDQKTVRTALHSADLLLAIGAELMPMSLPSEIEPLPPGLPIIQFHLDPYELAKNYPARVAALADPKETLPELEKAVEERLTADYRREALLRIEGVRRKKEEERKALKEKAQALMRRTPIAPLALLEGIFSRLPADAVVVDETISSGRGLRALFKGEDPKSYFGIRGGGIGWGLPASLGVKLALENRPVLALIGDGSAMYSYQALWTAARYGLAVVVVICNNRSYRILKERTRALGGFSAQTGTYLGMDLIEPAIDFVGLAKSLGVPGERCDKMEQVEEALARALDHKGPVLIDVALDGSF
jgi:benzoylformate decarboxylase